MPTNRAAFTELMKKAYNAAWDQNWAEAIALYRRALVESPEEVAAHAALANALEENGELEPALHEYLVASKLAPNDPVPVAHLGQIQEKLGRRSDAATTYVALAEFFVKHQQVGHALKAWQRAAALEPDRPDIHEKLAQVYREAGHHPQAVKEYLVLARLYQKRGERDQAVNSVEQGLSLEGGNPALKKLQEDLKGALAIPAIPAVTQQLGEAQRVAISRLAETILDDPARRSKEAMRLETLLSRAIEAQTGDRKAEATELYEQVLAAGVTRVDVLFNLGLLYREQQRYNEAVRLLEQTTGVQEYALSSHFALGQCYHATGQMQRAIEHLLQVMQIVDLAQVKRGQADEVVRLYETLADSYKSVGNTAQAQKIFESLIAFLSQQGWQDKVVQVRQHVTGASGAGMAPTLSDVADITASPQVLEALNLSEEYSRQNLHRAARDEALEAITLAPGYLPAHVRLAESLWGAGLGDEAVEKYRILARMAETRGDVDKARSLYQRLLQLRGDDQEAQRNYAMLLAEARNGA